MSRLPWFGIVLVLPVLVWGIFGPLLFPHDPTAMNLLSPHKPPAWLPGGQGAFLLGTDQFGRDVLSQLIAGARPALIVSFCGVALAAAIGIPAGLAAGYFGGWTDNLVMRLVDVKMSIPSILLTLLIGGAIGGGLTTVLVSIVLIFWADYARVVRSQALTLRDADYVALARVANCSDLRILATHVFPNILPTAIILMTIAAIGIYQLRPTWQDQQANAGMDQVKSTLRQARETAVAQRRSIVVKFATAGTSPCTGTGTSN